jgi:hypothetical protein
MPKESRNSRPRKTSIAWQQHGKHFSAVANNYATTEELLEVVFSLPSLLMKNELEFLVSLSSMETWCERWNININEDKTQGIYFPRSPRPPKSHPALNGRNIPFVNSVKYIGVIFDKKVT